MPQTTIPGDDTLPDRVLITRQLMVLTSKSCGME